MMRCVLAGPNLRNIYCVAYSTWLLALGRCSSAQLTIDSSEKTELIILNLLLTIRYTLLNDYLYDMFCCFWCIDILLLACFTGFQPTHHENPHVEERSAVYVFRTVAQNAKP